MISTPGVDAHEDLAFLPKNPNNAGLTPDYRPRLASNSVHMGGTNFAANNEYEFFF